MTGVQACTLPLSPHPFVHSPCSPPLSLPVSLARLLLFVHMEKEENRTWSNLHHQCVSCDTEIMACIIPGMLWYFSCIHFLLLIKVLDDTHQPSNYMCCWATQGPMKFDIDFLLTEELPQDIPEFLGYVGLSQDVPSPRITNLTRNSPALALILGSLTQSQSASLGTSRDSPGIVLNILERVSFLHIFSSVFYLILPHLLLSHHHVFHLTSPLSLTLFHLTSSLSLPHLASLSHLIPHHLLSLIPPHLLSLSVFHLTSSSLSLIQFCHTSFSLSPHSTSPHLFSIRPSETVLRSWRRHAPSVSALAHGLDSMTHTVQSEDQTKRPR